MRIALEVLVGARNGRFLTAVAAKQREGCRRREPLQPI